MENLKDSTNTSMLLIAHSGDARSAAFNALAEAKKGNYEASKELMRESKRCSILAHQAQTDLLVQEANGERADINVLLIHSQDHLMTSMLAMELIGEMIELYQSKEDRKENVK